MNSRFDRRIFLKGLGAGIAVPWLETFARAGVLAAEKSSLGTTATGAPLRTAFLYKPNGVNISNWALAGTGSDFKLEGTHAPYANFKDDLHFFGKLEHQNGTAGGDGGGDHARANASFLTGARPRKTAGADIKLGVSVDQVIANHIGDETRFSSLEFSCDEVRKAGVCDSGYSCAYQFNLSWRSDTTPMTPESNPRHVFERLFGSGTKGERKKGFALRNQRQRSILDFVLEDAKQLNQQLGRNDQLKLDEYMTGVREIERRIEKSETFGLPDVPNAEAPAGIPTSYEEHVRLMMDMLVLAFETDSTRVVSFLLAHDGSNRSFKEVGVSEGHHSISHHQNKPDLLEKLAKIDLFYSQQFAYFLEQLKSRKDVDGNTLLHNSIVVWGSGLADPNSHRHTDLPIVVAGQGGGTIKTGLHTDLGQATPMSNLFLSFLDRYGIKEERFGDSTARISQLS
ncbi:MAG: DUF1552 domain-containing protein [Verrucomicrobiales bacterium]|jgi:hypothetical protein|nr:DUF1552 domain-containing protein [Verrucomicrobiales bacterium]